MRLVRPAVPLAVPIAQRLHGVPYHAQNSREGVGAVAPISTARTSDHGPPLAPRLSVLTTFENQTCMTGGLDIGVRSVKMAILSHSGGESAVVAKAVVQIPGCGDDAHESRTAIRDSWRQVLREANLSARDVDLIASTGSGARPAVRVGRLYGQSSYALGARLLFPDGTVALEVDVDQIHCVLLKDPTGRIRPAERNNEPFGAHACRSEWHVDGPSAPSDGVSLAEQLATRAARLLSSLTTSEKVVLTGGMVRDAGFVQSLWTELLTLDSQASLLISPEATFAGAYGAAILAARRFARLSRSSIPGFTDPFVARLPDRRDQSLN